MKIAWSIDNPPNALIKYQIHTTWLVLIGGAAPGAWYPNHWLSQVGHSLNTLMGIPGG